jgi:gamma-glutamyltranspeptidase/glutathione hydrolase
MQQWLWRFLSHLAVIAWGLASTSQTVANVGAPQHLRERGIARQTPVAPLLGTRVPAVPQETQANTQPPSSKVKPALQALGRLRCEPGVGAVRGSEGMVVSVNPQATEVGVGVLEAGGNAVDAAVAVAFALAVTHPSAGNLGGGGFWLIHRELDTAYALDFRETAPRGLDRARFESMMRAGGQGPDSVAIPGTVAGLFEAHRRFGKLPWHRLLEDAIQLARNGYVVSAGESASMRKAWPLISKNAELSEQLQDGNRQPPKAGSKTRRPALARTLEAVRDAGRDGFYRGAVAESVVQALGPNGLIAGRDLAEYQARWRSPREFRYRDYLIRTMPLPSAGGVALLEGLLLLEQQPLANTVWGSAQHLHLLLEIQRRADCDRLLATSDPDRLAPLRLRELEALYGDPHHWDKQPIDPARASASLDTLEVAHESDNTTHFSVVDGRHTIVSATVTLSSPFGSKVATSTGVVLNNTLASFALSGENQARPGQRTTSSMAPTFVYDASGPVLALGTPGGDTIPSTLLQIISNVVDFRMPFARAIDAPRVHQSYALDRASFELGRPPAQAILSRLKRMGHRFEPRGTKQGDAKCVLLSNGVLWGYADPREGGLARPARAPVRMPPER